MFPPDIISYCPWLYFRFSLSSRDIEELVAQRGIVLTYGAIRQGYLKFGQMYANELPRRLRCGDKWHLDKVFLTINGKRHSLWRAVDQHGTVLDIVENSHQPTRQRERTMHDRFQIWNEVTGGERAT